MSASHTLDERLLASHFLHTLREEAWFDAHVDAALDASGAWHRNC
jgi:hypothetical protein